LAGHARLPVTVLLRHDHNAVAALDKSGIWRMLEVFINFEKPLEGVGVLTDALLFLAVLRR
jgi:hypothetical protein